MAKICNLEKDLEITLINKDPYHGLRPRYYENNLDNTRIALETFLTPLNVQLIIGDVIKIDYQTREVFLNSRESYQYDKLILATGSHLYMPNIPGLEEYAFNVDTYQAAKKLQTHIQSLPKKKGSGRHTIIVAGGGFTGVEAATELMDRLQNIAVNNKARVIVIDRSKVASRFSQETKTVILNAFHDMGIESISDVQIKRIEKDHVILDSGEIIDTDTVVWTAGMQSSKLTKEFAVKQDRFGRLPVDRFLRIQDVENCFAAGDVAAATTDGKHMALLSCQHAMPQGRVAGNNAVAELFGKELVIYEQPKFVTSIDLGSWGALYSEGWDQHVVEVKEAAKKIKVFINHDRIYPPSVKDGVEKLLKAAEPTFKPIKL